MTFSKFVMMGGPRRTTNFEKLGTSSTFASAP